MLFHPNVDTTILSAGCPHCAGRKTRRSVRQSLWENLIHLALISPYRCTLCHKRFFRLSPIVALDSALAQRRWGARAGRRLKVESIGLREAMHHPRVDTSIIRSQAPILWKGLRKWMATQCRDLNARTRDEVLKCTLARDTEIVVIQARTGSELRITYHPSEVETPQTISYELSGGAAQTFSFQRSTGTSVVLTGPDGSQHTASGFGVLLLDLVMAKSQANTRAAALKTPEREAWPGAVPESSKSASAS